MDDYSMFKNLVFKKTGIDLSSYKEKQMKRRIEALASRRGFSNLANYFHRLDEDTILLNEFVNYITINVSEFFRNPAQWQTLREVIMPMLLGNNKELKIWSSACSTGEEPYSLVMMLSEIMAPEKIKVIATDIDMGAIEKAKIGVYKENSLKNLSQQYVKKFFVKVPDGYRISEDVKRRVDFGRLDLLKDSFPSGCHLVLCRNVLIYFTDQAKQQIYNKFGRSLVSKGILFVGSTEQIVVPGKYGFVSLKPFFYCKEG
jgi:chemotaxis protein methyltransferase CheR